MTTQEPSQNTFEASNGIQVTPHLGELRIKGSPVHEHRIFRVVVEALREYFARESACHDCGRTDGGCDRIVQSPANTHAPSAAKVEAAARDILSSSMGPWESADPRWTGAAERVARRVLSLGRLADFAWYIGWVEQHRPTATTADRALMYQTWLSGDSGAALDENAKEPT